MAIRLKGTIAHLQGDLTHSGVTQNIINTLAVTLRKTELLVVKNIRIDCKKIKSLDVGGLQLLYVWMQCARFRGVQTELCNMPDNLQRDMKNMGLDQCFTGNNGNFEAFQA